MALTLTLRENSPLPIEVDGLLPATLRGKSPAEIERWPIQHGNQRVPLAELFHLDGDASDARLAFAGDCRGVHRIGTRMTEGEIHVAADAGRHLGSEMSGGRITVAGSAGDWLGAAMHGGLIEVRGSAGDNLGAAYRGAERGMIGGTILVHGDAGDEVGHTMRRGLIAVGGRIGDFAGVNMIAGSIFVCGACGARPGAGMQRGTLALLGPRPALLPTFRSGGPCNPLFLRVYLREISRLGLAVADGLSEAVYELFHGDLVTLGRGEILLRS